MTNEHAYLTAALSIEGRRWDQEDQLWCSADASIVVVADGLSAYGGGGCAARMTIKGAQELEPFAPGPRDDLWFQSRLARRWLNDAHIAARQCIEAQRVGNAHLQSMGAAALFALRLGAHLYIGHLGDVKAFLVRDGRVELLNKADHVRVRNFLKKYVGNTTLDEMDFVNVELQGGDVIIFCTDGLHDVVPAQRMAEIVQAHQLPHEIAAELGNAVGNEKSLENVAAVVMKVVPVVP